MESSENPKSGKFPHNFFQSGEFRKHSRRIGEPMFFRPGEFYKWFMEQKAKRDKEKGESNENKPEAA